MEDAEQVDLNLVAQLLLGNLFDRPEQAIAGIVHDHIEATEVGHGHLDSTIHARAIRDVQRQRSHAVAELRDQQVEAAGVATCGRDAVTPQQRRLGELKAEAAVCPSDEPDF